MSIVTAASKSEVCSEYSDFRGSLELDDVCIAESERICYDRQLDKAARSM